MVNTWQTPARRAPPAKTLMKKCDHQNARQKRSCWRLKNRVCTATLLSRCRQWICSLKNETSLWNPIWLSVGSPRTSKVHQSLCTSIMRPLKLRSTTNLKLNTQFISKVSALKILFKCTGLFQTETKCSDLTLFLLTISSSHRIRMWSMLSMVTIDWLERWRT